MSIHTYDLFCCCGVPYQERSPKKMRSRADVSERTITINHIFYKGLTQGARSMTPSNSASFLLFIDNLIFRKQRSTKIYGFSVNKLYNAANAS